MDMMNNSIEEIKKFTIRVGKTLVHFSKRGVKVRPRYRVMLLNDSRMSTVWQLKGTRSRLLFIAVIVFFIITFLGGALIGMTPLRTMLPGYLKRSQRSEMVVMSARVDSMQHITAVNNMYLNNVMAILNNEIDLDSIQQAYNDSIERVQLPVDSLLATSRTEREFVRRYEQRERFNVSVLSPVAADGMIFYPPVTNKITQAVEQSGRTTYQLQPLTPISAIYRGTVISQSYNPDTQEYTIIIQHPHDFISVYGGIGTPMVEPGDKVNTGQRIGLSSDIKGNNRPPVTLEMWYNGSQLDPAPYIDNKNIENNIKK